MRLSFLFLIVSLLTWGYLTQTLSIAIGLLILFAIINSELWHWTISTKQLNRWGDISSILVVLILIYAYLTKTPEQPIFILLKCLPIVFAPVVLAQFLTKQTQIPLSVLFYALRKKHRAEQTIDFTLVYSAIAIVSAGQANIQDLRYLSLSTAFFVMVLGFKRPKHSYFALWFLLIIMASILGFFGQLNLRNLHIFIEQKSIELFSNLQTDPFKAQTAIGDIGELKLSSKIEFRVKAYGQLLLYQASYDKYLGQTWIAFKRNFSADNPNSKNQAPLKYLEILQQRIGDKILALPDGVVEIKGLEAASIQYSELGAVKIEAPNESVNYQVFYTGKRTGKPTNYDLQIPVQHAQWLKQIYQTLNLNNLPKNIIADRIKDYFQANYYYSLYLGKETNPDTALKNFIFNTKSGHCEYFATATVLLLRQAGIPARFATGYSVSEYIPEQDLYLVRSRDAHAWAIAYIDGVWQAVDSTPAQWRDLETKNADTLWQSVSDTWSNMIFLIKQLPDEQTKQIKIALVCLAVIYFVIRLLGQKYSADKKTKHLILAYTGLDSEFYLLEQQLKNTKQARLADETLQQWVTRLNNPELIALCQLHYQLRFDPLGLTTEQRQQLRQQVLNFLATHKQEKHHGTV